ncbi:MAG: GumC family protein, partial [Flavobacterium sp.]
MSIENKSVSEETSTLNIGEIIAPYLYQWKWFVLCALLCVTGAFLYLRYTTPLYSASATIMIKDDKKGDISSELSAFNDLGAMAKVKSNLDNEIEVLKARTLARKTVQRLGYNISYFSEGQVRTVELYKSAPFVVDYIAKNENFYDRDTLFYVKVLSQSTFELYDSNKKQTGKYRFGATFKNGFGTMVIKDTLIGNNKPDGELIMVKQSNIDGVTGAFRSNFKVAPVDQTASSVLILSVVSPVKEKGVDYINALIETYNQDAISDKNQVAKKTDEFIRKRLDSIKKELADVEGQVELFKHVNKVTELPADTESLLESSSLNDRLYFENQVQLGVVGEMRQYLRNSKISDIIPANIIPENAPSGLIAEYNDLVLLRNKLIEAKTGPENPELKSVDQKLRQLRSNLTASLENLYTSVKVKQRDLAHVKGDFNGQIIDVSRKERQFREIDRQQKVKNELYLYLLQKKEENA